LHCAQQTAHAPQAGASEVAGCKQTQAASKRCER
jgi:hypothetical protein